MESTSDGFDQTRCAECGEVDGHQLKCETGRRLIAASSEAEGVADWPAPPPPCSVSSCRLDSGHGGPCDFGDAEESEADEREDERAHARDAERRVAAAMRDNPRADLSSERKADARAFAAGERQGFERGAVAVLDAVVRIGVAVVLVSAGLALFDFAVSLAVDHFGPPKLPKLPA